jgi:DMSO/TMAO reductase YedYZ molybdopterin-dependent catalytic subunit
MAEQTTRKRLPPGQELVGPGKWPTIGEKRPANSVPPDRLNISGCVATPITWSVGQLQSMPQTQRVLDIHCVTRWSKFDVEFSGVLLGELLAQAGVTDEAHSERRHSTSLPLPVALQHETMIALAANGQPLPVEHGGPIRNIVPDKYFYKSVKWLCEIELLAEDRLGFWEAESGYHNNADPWKVERYMAPTIDRRTAAKLIESRDFSGRDLRSIDASSRNLDGLDARNALLRDANFEKSSLQNADFSGANLSNAHFRNANLTGAKFIGTDLEGSDLVGADLSGADLTGCSLIGASFCEFDAAGKIHLAATLTESTKLEREALSALGPSQFAFVTGPHQ